MQQTWKSSTCPLSRARDCSEVRGDSTGSSACFSGTLTKVVLSLEAHRTEGQGITLSVAKVVSVKLRGTEAGSGPWHFCEKSEFPLRNVSSFCPRPESPGPGTSH